MDAFLIRLEKLDSIYIVYHLYNRILQLKEVCKDSQGSQDCKIFPSLNTRIRVFRNFKPILLGARLIAFRIFLHFPVESLKAA